MFTTLLDLRRYLQILYMMAAFIFNKHRRGSLDHPGAIPDNGTAVDSLLADVFDLGIPVDDVNQFHFGALFSPNATSGVEGLTPDGEWFLAADLHVPTYERLNCAILGKGSDVPRYERSISDISVDEYETDTSDGKADSSHLPMRVIHTDGTDEEAEHPGFFDSSYAATTSQRYRYRTFPLVPPFSTTAVTIRYEDRVCPSRLDPGLLRCDESQWICKKDNSRVATLEEIYMESHAEKVAATFWSILGLFGEDAILGFEEWVRKYITRSLTEEPCIDRLSETVAVVAWNVFQFSRELSMVDSLSHLAVLCFVVSRMVRLAQRCKKYNRRC